MRKIVREWLIRLTLMTGSLVVALVICEAVVRVFFPLYDGRDNVTLDGKRITSWLEAGSVYRQVSNEYNALTTITNEGYRGPRAADGRPDVVFLGDSFTYGYGLEDNQTFPSIYCAERHLSCANLGQPGSGTARQVRRFEQLLTRWNWQPKEVKLFFFGMSTSFSSGNDFADNYNYGRWLRQQAAGGRVATASASTGASTADAGIVEQVVASQKTLLAYSTLLRRAKYHWGPLLKSMVVADPGNRMTEALEYTREGLQELDALSKRAGFTYKVYLLVPVHDIMRGTQGETLATLNGVSPKPVIETASIFADHPQEYYYAFDGHFNQKGTRRLAEYLVSLENTSSSVQK